MTAIPIEHSGTTTITTIEVLHDNESWDIPCEQNKTGPAVNQCPNAAKWILYRVKCCPFSSSFLLLCATHKDRMLNLPPPVECVLCHHTFASVGDVITSVEPLDRRPG